MLGTNCADALAHHSWSIPDRLPPKGHHGCGACRGVRERFCALELPFWHLYLYQKSIRDARIASNCPNYKPSEAKVCREKQALTESAQTPLQRRSIPIFAVEASHLHGLRDGFLHATYA
jgi:hypothetical protein